MPVPSAPSFLRFEHQAAGCPALGLGAAAPRLSWQVGEAPDGYRKGVYEPEVRRGDAEAEVVRVESAEQVLVPWPVAPLASREGAEVRVRGGRRRLERLERARRGRDGAAAPR